MHLIQDLISQHLAWPAAGIFSPLHRAAWHAMARKRDVQLSATADGIRREQCRRLRRLLSIHRSDEQLRDVLQGISGSDDFSPSEILAGLPLVSRSDLQQIHHRPPAPGARGVYRNQSGGSSGEPVSLWQDWNFAVESLATTFLADRVHGWTPGRRYAWLWGNRRESGVGGWKRNVNRWLKNEVILDAFALDEQQLREYVDFLDVWRPDVLLGYASALEALALYLKDQDRRAGWPGRGVISSAEMLHEKTRNLLEEVFPVQVFDRYGSREAGTIAFQCGHGGLHLSPLDHIVEIIPPAKMESSPLPPPGEDGPEPLELPGEIVVTVLTNFATPLIRYRLGDMGRLATGICSCGSRVPRLAELHGRTSDLFRLPDGRVVHGERFTHVVWGMTGIHGFQFVQNTPREFTLSVVVDHGQFTADLSAQIRQKLLTILGDGARLQIQQVAAIPPSPSGKRQFTIALNQGH